MLATYFNILTEWLIALARWLHVMAGIAWVGTSFYFNWFDSLVRKNETDKPVKENPRGTLEEIHGGSFYYHEQYWPNTHPTDLKVHSWPAKTTLLSGLFLLIMIYWLGAGTYLIDRRVADIAPWQAIIFSGGSIVLAWIFYSFLCWLTKDKPNGEKVIFAVMGTFTVLMSFAFYNIFGGRGAFISVGAMLGSLMGLNVWFVIVPNHIAMRKNLRKGKAIDRYNGKLAKRHSQHNNYFTLPVVFAMIGNHFSIMYQHKYSWIILSLVMFAGWAIRHTLNVNYRQGRKDRLMIAGIIAAILCAIALSMVGQTSIKPPEAEVSDTEALKILTDHCAACHSTSPTFGGFSSPPAGLVLTNLEDLVSAKDKVIEQVITSQAMPLGNLTNMTEAERGQLHSWLSGK